MIKSVLFKATAAAAATVALLGAAPAHAYVYALSGLDVRGLTIGTTGILPFPTSYTFNLQNNATLLGNSAFNQASCNGTATATTCGSSPTLNAVVANAPGSVPVRAENNFSHIGTGASSYSNSDSVILTSELVNGVPSSSRQIAESLLNTNGDASSGARVQSNTNLLYNFTTGSTTNLTLDFEANPDLRAAINDLMGAYSSQADISVTFTLTRTSAGGGSLTWTPRGTFALGASPFGTAATNDCDVSGALSGSGVTCSERADSESLNYNISTGANPTDINTPTNFENGVYSVFGISVFGIPAGTYSLALAANTSTSIVRQAEVPEPGSVALVGLALAALGATTVRRRRVA